MVNLSEEEKEAIEQLNKKYKFISENPLATNVFTTLDTHNLGIILNLIDRLQKDNKSKEKQIKLMQSMNLPREIEINYVSKDKIKDKIKELVRQQDYYREKGEIDEYYAKIEVLEDILKEN